MPDLKDYVNNKTVYTINFSQGINSPESIEPVSSDETSFSNNGGSGIRSDIGSYLMNFTLRSYIKERKLIPRTMFKRRLDQVVRYVNSNAPEKVIANKDYLIDYINDYMNKVINNYMLNKDPKSGKNFIVTLGLTRHLSDLKSARRLQRVLKQLIKNLSTTGTMRKDLQRKVRSYYKELFNDLMSTLSDKRFNEDKKGILNG